MKHQLKAIWKYPLNVSDDVPVEMPKGAKVLTVQVQNGTPCIWAEVDPEATKVERTFRIIGTGHQHPNEYFNGTYIGSFQLSGGAFVGHLYELT